MGARSCRNTCQERDVGYLCDNGDASLLPLLGFYLPPSWAHLVRRGASVRGPVLTDNLPQEQERCQCSCPLCVRPRLMARKDLWSVLSFVAGPATGFAEGPNGNQRAMVAQTQTRANTSRYMHALLGKCGDSRGLGDDVWCHWLDGSLLDVCHNIYTNTHVPAERLSCQTWLPCMAKSTGGRCDTPHGIRHVIT